jgi:hypothetical protein
MVCIMEIDNPDIAVGMFGDLWQAQAVVRDLYAAGFDEDRVGLVVRQVQADAVHCLNTHPEAFQRADGAMVAGGLLPVSLVGGMGGAIFNGLISALMSLGIWEDEARDYKNEFLAGRTIVAVRAAERYDEAVAILRQRHVSTFGLPVTSESAPVVVATA